MDPTDENAGRTKDGPDPTSRENRQLGRGLFDEDMGPGSAMAHLYRGEIHRMKFWRERLDRTTYWAVTVIAAILTWAFSSHTNPHYIVLIAVAILSVFLVIEARRFRGYDIWRSRVRLLQKNVFAYALDPSRSVSDPQWRAELSEDYRSPKMKISFEESLAHRLRRVYFPLYALLLAAWLIRVTGYAASPWPSSAAIGPVPGVVVVGIVAASYVGLAVIAYRPRQWRVERELEGYEIDPWE
ncbi:DUF2270 domain-containing protein [Halegenticoccus soli]|uniref:DUF2270 domain-containing protein n=1 Tax=Halegenticoccus soli TaxID=1985678 RepID=UPI000C6D424A|nr:DUF2270 domain-containing protein [Halegenticoccus soli]